MWKFLFAFADSANRRYDTGELRRKCDLNKTSGQMILASIFNAGSMSGRGLILLSSS